MAGRMPINAKFPLRKKVRRRRAKPSASGQRRPRKRERSFLSAVARLPSVINGSTVEIQVCHIRFADADWNKRGTGMQEKPDDRWCLPLTAGQHLYHKDAQHKGNERAFWKRYGIDALAVSNELYKAWRGQDNKFDAEEQMAEIIAIAATI